MVEVSEKEYGVRMQSEKFFLDEAKTSSGYVLIGLLICWLIADDKKTKFIKLYGGCGNGGSKCVKLLDLKDSDGETPSLKAISDVFLNGEVLCWHLDCMIDEIPVSFHGHSYGTFVGVSMPEDKNINVEELLLRVEGKTKYY